MLKKKKEEEEDVTTSTGLKQWCAGPVQTIKIFLWALSLYSKYINNNNL